MKENETKERILEVSRALFIEKGFNGTSIRDIAAEADVNVALINYYYRSKQDLFEIIFDESANILLNKIFSIIKSDTSFYDLLSTWLSSYYEMLMQNSQLPIFVLNEVHQRPQHLLGLITHRNPSDIIDVITNRINEEIDKGTIKNVSVNNLILSIISLCVFPYILGGILKLASGDESQEYHKLLDNHKNYAIKFITNAIKA
jgi:AcrR family transcriptional regulator